MLKIKGNPISQLPVLLACGGRGVPVAIYQQRATVPGAGGLPASAASAPGSAGWMLQPSRLCKSLASENGASAGASYPLAFETSPAPALGRSLPRRSPGAAF